MSYLSQYPLELQNKIQHLMESGQLGDFITRKYPDVHTVGNNGALYDFVMSLKQQYLKKSNPVSKIEFDPKIHVINNALGTHRYVSRNHGGKLKAKNEIRISTLFKKTPEAFLTMITVHELAHLKEKDHNKAFYQLCRHMMPDYHQVEFDVRVYLTHLEAVGELY